VEVLISPRVRDVARAAMTLGAVVAVLLAAAANFQG
jgi:hypothetical protein